MTIVRAGCGCLGATREGSQPATHGDGSLSIGFNVSVSLFGGTTPLVVTALIGATGDVMMPAYYMMAAAVIGRFAVWRMAESAGRPLPGSPPSLAPGTHPVKV